MSNYISPVPSYLKDSETLHPYFRYIIEALSQLKTNERVFFERKMADRAFKALQEIGALITHYEMSHPKLVEEIEAYKKKIMGEIEHDDRN